MKSSNWHRPWITLATIVLVAPAGADVVYSNLQNSSIPSTLTGLYVDVNGDSNWDVNPFFGGVGVANSPYFQPARNGTGDLDRILNFAVGDTIDIGEVFATSNGGANYGGSQDHLALSAGSGKFVADQVGYMGFRLNGVGYGWMRVVFSGNSGNAVVKDWAYDTGGNSGSIVIGRVEQKAASGGTQEFDLTPQTGESFTLGSVIFNTGGNTNFVIKTGGGSTTLSQPNTYTGGTTVSNGTLLVSNTSGSGTGTGAVTVDSGATLGGDGTIAPTGSNGINVSGVLAPGGSLDTMILDLSGTTGTASMASGASFAFALGTANPSIGSIGLNTSDMLGISGANAADFAFNSNNVDFLGTGGIGFYKLFDTDSNNANTWTGLTFDGTTGVVSTGLTFTSLASGYTGQFLIGTSGNGGTVGDIYFQVIPEPHGALLGGLGVMMLLRRRRQG